MPWPWEYSLYEKCAHEICACPNRTTVIGGIALLILQQFLEGSYFSTYQIFKNLKEKRLDHGMAYKDVHKRIKRLHELKLIEKVPFNEISSKFESLHNAIFYRLTKGGIFKLYSAGTSSNLSKPEVLQYHGNNLVFETFLYPFIERSTLSKIKGGFFLELLSSFLEKCCEFIDEYVEALSKGDGSRVHVLPLFDWNQVPGESNEEMISRLAIEYKVDLAKNPRIVKCNKGKRINILDKKTSVIIDINDKKNKATLTFNEKEKFQLVVERSDNRLIVGKKVTFKELGLWLLDYRIKHNLLYLAFSVIMRRTIPVSPIGENVLEATLYDKEDYNILAQDQKFAALLENIYIQFRYRYKEFAKLKTGIL